jgi:hypothetical protein
MNAEFCVNTKAQIAEKKGNFFFKPISRNVPFQNPPPRRKI